LRALEQNKYRKKSLPGNVTRRAPVTDIYTGQNNNNANVNRNTIMSQSDYEACVCMASSKLKLKFENLPLSVMYYGGDWVAEVVGVKFNKPAKIF